MRFSTVNMVHQLSGEVTLYKFYNVCSSQQSVSMYSLTHYLWRNRNLAFIRPFTDRLFFDITNKADSHVIARNMLVGCLLLSVSVWLKDCISCSDKWCRRTLNLKIKTESDKAPEICCTIFAVVHKCATYGIVHTSHIITYFPGRFLSIR